MGFISSMILNLLSNHNIVQFEHEINNLNCNLVRMQGFTTEMHSKYYLLTGFRCDIRVYEESSNSIPYEEILQLIESLKDKGFRVRVKHNKSNPKLSIRLFY